MAIIGYALVDINLDGIPEMFTAIHGEGPDIFMEAAFRFDGSGYTEIARSEIEHLREELFSDYETARAQSLGSGVHEFLLGFDNQSTAILNTDRLMEFFLMWYK